MNKKSPSSTDLLLLAVRLGATGFGGPLAVVAQLENAVCDTHGWLTHEEFARELALCKLLPGPLALLMILAVNRRLASTPVSVAAGVLYVLPASLLVGALAMGANLLPNGSAIERTLTSFSLAALALILLSLVQLGRPYLKTWPAWFISIISTFVVGWRPWLEPIAVVAAGMIWIQAQKQKSQTPVLNLSAWLPLIATVTGVLFISFFPLPLPPTFQVGFRSSALVFGSGLAIVPVLQHEWVNVHQWVDSKLFAEALAIGQSTPGPVMVTAVYLASRVFGGWEGLASGIGVFLPSFIYARWGLPALEKLLPTGSSAFLHGAIPAVVGALAAAVIKMGIPLLDGQITLIIAWLIAVESIRRIKAPAWAQLLILTWFFYVSLPFLKY